MLPETSQMLDRCRGEVSVQRSARALTRIRLPHASPWTRQPHSRQQRARPTTSAVGTRERRSGTVGGGAANPCSRIRHEGRPSPPVSLSDCFVTVSFVFGASCARLMGWFDGGGFIGWRAACLQRLFADLRLARRTRTAEIRFSPRKAGIPPPPSSPTIQPPE